MARPAAASSSRPARPQDLLPQWTKRVLVDSGGRDPLGLSRVSQLIADDLLKAVITITPRARYYSLYAWMLWHIEREDRPKDRAAFARALQRREAAVALASLLSEDEAAVLGSNATTKQLAEAQERGQVDAQFRILPSAEFGGFGNNYAGCLNALHLISRDEHGIDRVTQSLGAELAVQTQKSLEKTPYLQKRSFASPVFSFQVLEESSERLALKALNEAPSAGERSLLTEILFGFKSHPTDRSARNRRLSLGRLLSVVAAYQDAELPLAFADVSSQALYLPTYFGVLAGEGGEVRPYDLPAPLRASHAAWRQFCLHEYVTWALEGLLVALLDVVEANRGISAARVVDELCSAPFSAWLEERLGGPCETPSALLAQVLGRPTQPSSDSVDFSPRFSLNDELSEASVHNAAYDTPAELAARSCLLLAVLFASWEGTADEAFHQIRAVAGSEPWAGPVLALVRGWKSPLQTWKSALTLLVEKWVVARHEQVVYEKGRLQSSWFHLEDGGLVFDQSYRPYFRQDRLPQASQILIDLGLLEQAEGLLRITTAGREVLGRVLEAA